MKKTKWLFLIGTLCIVSTLSAQRDFYKTYTFTEADTIRGMLRPERTCYDVTFYNLDIRIDIASQSIEGFVDVYYTAVSSFQRLQIDLFKNMEISKIEFQGKPLKYTRLHDAVFVEFPRQEAGLKGQFRVHYSGKPIVAANAPWDGGFVWEKDNNGDPWVGVACEGDGASLWWPNKDHLSDEPDSMSIKVAVPRGLTCVANGNLRQITPVGGYDKFEWFVSYPINNYNVSVNIAKYAHWQETYTALDGSTMPMDFYVLSYNEERAKKHFAQTAGVLKCYEQFFDKYPFWNDGFAMVETPYLGMEHQGAIAYGNRYMRGYLGGMIPKDMNWDYIIVHETGHEYFGNSISAGDLSEMWIHESFTTYMEALYVECEYSYADAVRYLWGQRYMIGNMEPILGPMHVNWENWKLSDHYYKGAWILHTLRSVINDDDLFFDILKSFYRKHTISIVSTKDFIDYVNNRTGKDFTAFFEQYLWYPKVPTLEYRIDDLEKGVRFHYRWKADVEAFAMPFMVGEEGDMKRVTPNTKEWQSINLDIPIEKVAVANDLFLVDFKKKN